MGLGSNAVWSGRVSDGQTVGWSTEYAAVKKRAGLILGCAFSVGKNEPLKDVANALISAFNTQNPDGPYRAENDANDVNAVYFPGPVVDMKVDGIDVSIARGTPVPGTLLLVQRADVA